MDNHFFAALRARMPEGGRRFIETPDGAVMTYDDLLAGTARYARALQTLGAVPGDRIAIQIEKSADAVFLMLACIRAGFVILPLNTAYTGRRASGYCCALWCQSRCDDGPHRGGNFAADGGGAGDGFRGCGAGRG